MSPQTQAGSLCYINAVAWSLRMHGDRSEKSLSVPTADFVDVPEQVSGIFVNPGRTGAFKFLLAVAAGEQSYAKSPRPARRQHIPDRIANYQGVLYLGAEPVGRR